MTKHEFQIIVMDWMAGLPEDVDFDAAMIVALGPVHDGDKRSNWIGHEGTVQSYMDCIGALAENGAKHGLLHKTISMEKR
jgi:hypothetical protein